MDDERRVSASRAFWDAIDHLLGESSEERDLIDSPKILLHYCKACQDWLLSLATAQERAKSPNARVKKRSVNELVRALSNVACTLFDDNKGKEWSHVPEMPLGNATAHDASVYVRRLVVWSESLPDEMPAAGFGGVATANAPGDSPSIPDPSFEDAHLWFKHYAIEARKLLNPTLAREHCQRILMNAAAEHFGRESSILLSLPIADRPRSDWYVILFAAHDLCFPTIGDATTLKALKYRLKDNAESNPDITEQILGDALAHVRNDLCESGVEIPRSDAVLDLRTSTGTGEPDKEESPPSSEFTFRRDSGDYILTGFGESRRVPANYKGMGQIHRLIQAPGKSVPYFELTGATNDKRVNSPNDRRSRQPALDGQGFNQARQKVADLQDEQKLAVDSGNETEARRLQGEIDKLIAEYKTANGYKGKGLDLNNARNNTFRVNIAGTLKTAYKKMKERRLAKLAEHFDLAISGDGEGVGYRYSPAVEPRPDWKV